VALAGVTTWAPSKAISSSDASMRPVAVAANEPTAVPAAPASDVGICQPHQEAVAGLCTSKILPLPALFFDILTKPEQFPFF